VTACIAGGAGALKSGPAAHAEKSVVTVNANHVLHGHARRLHSIGGRRDSQRS
jgi:hypothetical protein